jgi:hypothetical protein
VPPEGESLGERLGRFPLLPLVGNLKEWRHPVRGGDPVVEVTRAEAAFPSVFAADVPADVTKVLAAGGRSVRGDRRGRPEDQAVLGAEGDRRRAGRCLARRGRLPAQGGPGPDPRSGARDELTYPLRRAARTHSLVCVRAALS